MVKVGKEEDIVYSETTNSPRDARGGPIEADHQGDLRNVFCGHRG